MVSCGAITASTFVVESWLLVINNTHSRDIAIYEHFTGNNSDDFDLLSIINVLINEKLMKNYKKGKTHVDGKYKYKLYFFFFYNLSGKYTNHRKFSQNIEVRNVMM